MFTKIKSFINIFILGIVIFLSFSLLRSIAKIAGSEGKITDEETSIQELEKENSDLQNELNSAQSPQFIESSARNKLGLAKPGEIVVVMPDEAALRNLAPKVSEQKFTLPDPNWKKWLKLFT